MTPLRLAVLGLVRRPLASALAITSLAVAFAAAGLVVTAAERNLRAVERIDAPYHAIVGPKSNGVGLLLEALELIEPNEEVIPRAMLESSRERFRFTQSIALHVFAKVRGAWVVATVPDYLAQHPARPPRIIEGRWLEDGVEGVNEAVVGVVTARRLGLAVGDPLRVRASPSAAQVADAVVRRPNLDPTRHFDPAPEPFSEDLSRPLFDRQVRVVGVIDHGGGVLDEVIFVHRGLGDTYYAAAAAHFLPRPVSDAGPTTYLLMTLANPLELTDFRRRIHRNSTVQFADIAEQKATLRAIASGAGKVVLALLAVVLGLAIAGVSALVNARYDTLRPRLGLLRALGYTRASVALTLALEALLITGAAVLFAVVLEAVLTLALGLPARVGLERATTVWPSTWNLAVWVVAIVSALPAALVPTLRLYRADVHTALQGA